MPGINSFARIAVCNKPKLEFWTTKMNAEKERRGDYDTLFTGIENE